MAIITALPDMSKESEKSLRELLANVQANIRKIVEWNEEEWRHAQRGLIPRAAALRNMQTNLDEFLDDLLKWERSIVWELRQRNAATL